MTTASQIYDFINSFAPFDTAMSFDNVGILVGSGQTASNRVLVALDADAGVIEEAASLGAGIVVTHHPVIFRAIKSLPGDSIPFLAVKNNITIISAHTNLDIAQVGVNASLAEAAGITADQVFEQECAIFGHLDKPADSDDYARQLCSRLNLSGMRYTRGSGIVKNAAVACGAGGDNVFLAADLGADAIITGEIKHHEIVYANDHGIAVFDLGHFGSENLIVHKLAGMLSGQFPDTIFTESCSFSDKLHYISGD